MKYLILAASTLAIVGCASTSNSSSRAERANEVADFDREPFLREQERNYATMVQLSREALKNMESMYAAGRATQLDIKRLQITVLEQQIEHDVVATELGLLRTGEGATRISALESKRAHINRVLRWLDELVMIRRDTSALMERRTEVGQASADDVFFARTEHLKTLIRVQEVRMQLAELTSGIDAP